MNALDVLTQRGFVKQCSDHLGLEALLSNSQVTFYAGFDPTAESFHVGSLVPIMAMAHLQRLGHKPIAIIGGGTGLIGDPSGKTELRKILSREKVAANMAMLSKQFDRYLVLDGERGMLIDNADWIAGLNYIDFLREIGRHFKVNEMMRSEGYRLRLQQEQGLSFIEFNYQLLQAYDFLVLYNRYNCRLQLGGDDQWGNILAGLNLIDKVVDTAGSGAQRQETKPFALTFPLMTTARGQKMGKTEGGAIWLDARETSSYDFYQYWINCDDRDVIRFLLMFTFLSLDEIEEFKQLQGADIRRAKERLAFETTLLCHGKEEAEAAQRKSRAAFLGDHANGAELPTIVLAKEQVREGVSVIDLLLKAGLVTSRGDAKRLIAQGGIYINDEVVESADMLVNDQHFGGGHCMLRRGQKRFHRFVMR
jgi:tyrosyl-tRNA synthetase